ncbi:MAG: hypothetical protein ACJ8HI_14520 [Massilia sp.]
MSITTMDVWKKYYASLTTLVAGPQFDASKQVISFAGNTLMIDIANADPLISNANIFNAGNVLPAWDACYTPQGGLLSTYSVFLDSIDLGGDINPNLQSQINQAQTAYNNAQANFTGPNGVQAQAITAWKQYQAIAPTIDLPTFVQSQFPLYLSAKSGLSGAESTLQGLLIKAYGAGFQVIATARNRCSSTAGAAAIDMQNAFNMGIKTGSVAPAGSGAPVLPGQTPPPSPSALISSYAPAFSLNGFTTIFQQWQADSAAGIQNGGPIKVSGGSGAGDWNKSGWSTSARASFTEFFSFSASGSAHSDTQSVNTQSDKFSLEVRFTGLQSVPINPGQWYDGGIVKEFKNRLIKSAQPFFGENGALGLLPTSLIVGFEPTITVTLENSDYQSLKSQYQANATASLDIGPFSIGSASYSTYSDKTAIKYDDDSATITIGPVKSAMPLLLGVISTKL